MLNKEGRPTTPNAAAGRTANSCNFTNTEAVRSRRRGPMTWRAKRPPTTPSATLNITRIRASAAKSEVASISTAVLTTTAAMQAQSTRRSSSSTMAAITALEGQNGGTASRPISFRLTQSAAA